MSYRQISGLEEAQPCSWPSCIPRPRARSGAKAQGLAYERALAKALPQALHGQWFEFRDQAGPGWCQPDLVLDLGTTLVVLEAKLRWVPEARGQVEWLYLPVVSRALGKPAVGLVVCKVLVPGIPQGTRVRGDLTSAIRDAAAGLPTVLHWIGVGKL